jgi:hypothetical protein
MAITGRDGAMAYPLTTELDAQLGPFLCRAVADITQLYSICHLCLKFGCVCVECRVCHSFECDAPELCRCIGLDLQSNDRVIALKQGRPLVSSSDLPTAYVVFVGGFNVAYVCAYVSNSDGFFEDEGAWYCTQTTTLQFWRQFHKSRGSYHLGVWENV